VSWFNIIWIGNLKVTICLLFCNEKWWQNVTAENHLQWSTLHSCAINISTACWYKVPTWFWRREILVFTHGHYHGCRKGRTGWLWPPLYFEILHFSIRFCQKRLFCLCRVGKIKLYHFWPPGKIFLATPGKICFCPLLGKSLPTLVGMSAVHLDLQPGVLLKAFEESANLGLLSSFCDHANLQIQCLLSSNCSPQWR